MPWFHHLYAKILFPKKVATFTHYGRDYGIKAHNKGNTIPLVNSDATKKVTKKSLFAYIIHVKESPSPCVYENSLHDNDSTQANIHNDDDDAERLGLNEFLHTYNSCFADKVPNKLAPISGDYDHRIELIQGSSPPNKAPYCISMTQQEEIMS